MDKAEVKLFVGDEDRSKDTYDCLLFRITYVWIYLLLFIDFIALKLIFNIKLEITTIVNNWEWVHISKSICLRFCRQQYPTLNPLPKHWAPLKYSTLLTTNNIPVCESDVFYIKYFFPNLILEDWFSLQFSMFFVY